MARSVQVSPFGVKHHPTKRIPGTSPDESEIPISRRSEGDGPRSANRPTSNLMPTQAGTLPATSRPLTFFEPASRPATGRLTREPALRRWPTVQSPDYSWTEPRNSRNTRKSESCVAGHQELVSLRPRTDESTILPHRFPFVCFVYFVVNNLGALPQRLCDRPRGRSETYSAGARRRCRDEIPRFGLLRVGHRGNLRAP